MSRIVSRVDFNVMFSLKHVTDRWINLPAFQTLKNPYWSATTLISASINLHSSYIESMHPHYRRYFKSRDCYTASHKHSLTHKQTPSYVLCAVRAWLIPSDMRLRTQALRVLAISCVPASAGHLEGHQATSAPWHAKDAYMTGPARVPAQDPCIDSARFDRIL